jgi:hemerythrin-like metal-binding protein
MPLVVWSDKLSVGVKSVDDQHTVLFKTINDLHDAMMKGQARAIVGELLKRLLTYTKNHFSEEEAMLKKVRYPGLAAHRLLHKDLTQQVEAYIARHEKGDLTLSMQLADFLSDWLKTHILNTDQTYGRWLKEQGLKVA